MVYSDLSPNGGHRILIIIFFWLATSNLLLKGVRNWKEICDFCISGRLEKFLQGCMTKNFITSAEGALYIRPSKRSYSSEGVWPALLNIN